MAPRSSAVALTCVAGGLDQDAESIASGLPGSWVCGSLSCVRFATSGWNKVGWCVSRCAVPYAVQQRTRNRSKPKRLLLHVTEHIKNTSFGFRFRIPRTLGTRHDAGPSLDVASLPLTLAERTHLALRFAAERLHMCRRSQHVTCCECACRCCIRAEQHRQGTLRPSPRSCSTGHRRRRDLRTACTETYRAFYHTGCMPRSS